MPPKAKKRRIQAGQLTLSFGHPTEQGTTLLVSRPLPSFLRPEEEPACNFNTEQASGTLKGPQERRGDVASWRSFAEHKWSSKHPWLVIQSDGVYCQYCSHTGSSVKSGSTVFVAESFTDCRLTSSLSTSKVMITIKYRLGLHACHHSYGGCSSL